MKVDKTGNLDETKQHSFPYIYLNCFYSTTGLSTRLYSILYKPESIGFDLFRVISNEAIIILLITFFYF